MLMGSPNYMIIRREIFGKVHGRGVKEIWLISQFPAKHKGVASGPKIVFAASGLARLCFSGQLTSETKRNYEENCRLIMYWLFSGA